MIIFGGFLIALGISWLMNVNVWSVVLISAGVVYILTGLFRSSRYSAWALPACCYPWSWVGTDPGPRRRSEDHRVDPENQSDPRSNHAEI